MPIEASHSTAGAASPPIAVQHTWPGAFEIVGVPSARMLRIAIIGLWNGDTTACFAAALTPAIAGLGTRPGEHLVLADITRSAIQTQDVVNRLSSLVARSPNRARRLALLGVGTGVRQQARRLLSVRENLALFYDEEEALAWLARGACTEMRRR